jgi:hypothetical protein
MIPIELVQFDQTAILFLAVSALALIRERKVLPFVVVLAGSLLQGPLVMVLLAALIAWHRMDRAASRWIQLKDLTGAFFLMASSMTVDALQAFFLVAGVFLVAVNLGGGMLGTLPAVVLLRQAYPHPESLEIGLGAGALFWVVSEILRFAKSKHEGQILAWAEALCSLLVLINFRAEAEKVAGEPSYLGLAGFILVAVLTPLFWARLRTRGFWSIPASGRVALSRILQGGYGLVSGPDRLTTDEPLRQDSDFRAGVDALLYWVFGIVLFAAAFILLARGGILNDF